jgi:Holliday junction resolvase-like predicted endonuclease
MKTNWHIATAAEAIAAAQFARLGFSVSVQYGANQPEYDLIVENGTRPLKISVKGSVNGGWGLSQSQLAKLKNANYKGAADEWLAQHKPGTAICLVQFQNAKFEEMPRIYLATPDEVATRLREASGGRGDTVLWENYTRGPKAQGAGTIERLPDGWRLSENRVNDLLLI